MSMATTTAHVINRETADTVMRAFDEATKATLAALGFETIRFDADVCAEENWMRLKIKIRPTT